MPLSGAGLWDAEIMTPKSARESAIRNAAAGVGTTPASNTSTPELASPAETAAERNSPEIRGSRATTATGRRPDARRPSAIRALAEHDCGRLRQVERQVDREVGVGESTDTVRAEQAGHGTLPDQRFEY